MVILKFIFNGIYGAFLLGLLGDKRAVESLILKLKDNDDDEVRTNAVEALGKLGDKKAVESLIASLKDKVENVCIEAAKALGRLGDKNAVESLIAMLKDKDKWERRNAANE